MINGVVPAQFKFKLQVTRRDECRIQYETSGRALVRVDAVSGSRQTSGQAYARQFWDLFTHTIANDKKRIKLIAIESKSVISLHTHRSACCDRHALALCRAICRSPSLIKSVRESIRQFGRVRFWPIWPKSTPGYIYTWSSYRFFHPNVIYL